LLEDSPLDAELTLAELEKAGFEVDARQVETEEEYLAHLQPSLDIVLADYHLPQFDAPAALRLLRRSGFDIPFIIVSGTVGEEAAVAAIKEGADDYLLKDRLKRLGPAILQAMEKRRLLQESRAAEEQLRASEARYRHLFKDNPMPMWVYDVTTLRFLAVNTAAVESYGYSRNEFLAMTITDLRAPLARPALGPQSQEKDDQKRTTGVSRHRKRDGEIVDVEITRRDIFFDSRPARLVLAMDISERIRAEEARHAAESKFRRLVDNSLVGIYVIQGDRFAYVNPKLAEIFGRPESDLVSRPLLEFVVEEDKALVAENIRRRLDGRVVSIQYSLRAARGDGEVIHLEALGGLTEFNGQPAILGTLMDVSQRLRAETELRESEERFRQLAENIGEVFWMTDARKKKVLYVSPAYDTVFGRSRHVLDQNPGAWIDSIEPEHRSRVALAAFSKQVAGQYNEVFCITRPDGSKRWIRDRAFPVKDADGEVYRIAGLAADITEQLALEDQLRQSQKMEAVGQLASGVAHDFNNILTVIQSYAQLLLDQEQPSHVKREQLMEILFAAERASGLTRRLLTFSRKQAIQRRALDVAQIASGMAKLLRRALGENILFVLDTPPKLPCIHGDAGMIEQILLNLAVNARDAMPSGGRLLTRLSAEVVLPHVPLRDSRARAGDFILVEVSDTGCGMPPEVQKRIFEPFFTTKAAGKGTGLGLATTFNIVQQHEGWIEVDSEVGRGTTFRVYLPVSTQIIDDTPQTSARAKVRGGSERILLVEDEPAVREMVTIILEHRGYRVLSAHSGTAALSVWEKSRDEIDLVITDMVMPDGLTGIQLAEKLRAQKPSIKIIFSSGYAANAEVDGVDLEEGVNFLQKPYHPEQLARITREQLDAGSPSA
jgi:PAS domain S-box-containing protein